VDNPCPLGSAANAAFAEAESPAIAAAGDVTLDLLAGGLVIATLVLPEGNSITYDPETSEVNAPSSNSGTLTLMTAGGERPLLPGETIVLRGTPVPAVSEWGVVVLTLLLLVCAKVYFSRREAEAVKSRIAN
jgi:hypothetical protein